MSLQFKPWGISICYLLFPQRRIGQCWEATRAPLRGFKVKGAMPVWRCPCSFSCFALKTKSGKSALIFSSLAASGKVSYMLCPGRLFFDYFTLLNIKQQYLLKAAFWGCHYFACIYFASSTDFFVRHLHLLCNFLRLAPLFILILSPAFIVQFYTLLPHCIRSQIPTFRFLYLCICL